MESESERSLAAHEDKLMLAWTLVTAGLIGAVTVGFMLATEHLGAWLHPNGDHAAWRRLLMPVLGAGLAGYLLRRFFPNSAGSGIPQTKAALILNNGEIPFRTAVGKFICSTITLASGVSLGREGPSVQVGAALASSLGRKLGLDRRRITALVPVGAAAAVSAAFNTPIAAVLFTLEELVGNLHAPLLGNVVLSAATSWMVMRALLGDEPLFHVPAYHMVHPVEFLFYALLGVGGGFVSAGFVKLLLRIRSWFATFPERTKWMQPMAGGLFAGIVAWFVPEVLGVGYPIVDDALNGKLVLQSMALLLGLKFLATAICYSSGNAGGIFGPSLFIGAMLGGVIGGGVHSLLPDATGSVGAYALAGMGAAFAGIVRAPLTSVIMIFEITRDYSIIVPLMISNLLSFFVSQRLQPEPVYEALLLQDNIHLPAARMEMTPRSVRDTMRARGQEHRSDAKLFPDEPMERALEVFAGLPDGAVASVRSRLRPDEELGVLKLSDVLADYRRVEPPPQPAAGRTLLIALAGALAVLLTGVSVFQYVSKKSRQEQAQASYAEGVELARTGRLDEAIEALRRSVSVLRGDEQRLVLARTLIQAGRWEEAQAFLREVLAQQPSLGPANFWMGKVVREEGNPTAARDFYNRAIYGDWPAYSVSNKWEARWELSDTLETLQAHDGALAELTQIAAENKNSREWQLRVAQRLYSLGRYERAAEVFLSVGGEDAGLGRSLFGAGRYAEATAVLERAVAAAPQRNDLARELELANNVARMDPKAKGLRARERLTRARDLLSKAQNAAKRCGAEAAAPGSGKTVDELMEEAESVWHSRPSGCTASADEEALQLLFAARVL
ncbi:MAG TPA: chloride channel protein [Bryobacteraceae bacterium]|nr:chloride channel protein [Bryobacteraceae bacterium]